MNPLKLIVAGATLGLIALAFRDLENERWLLPALPGELEKEPGEDALDEEPVLGYDGMDQETLLDWLADAELDDDSLLELLDYEQAHRNRGPVVDALEEMLE